MKQFLLVGILGFISLSTKAQFHEATCSHAKGFGLASAHYESKSIKSSAKNYDVHFMDITLEVENNSTFIVGAVELQAIAGNSFIDTLVLDLSDAHTVDSVVVNGVSASYTHGNELVQIQTALQPNANFSVKVWYSGNGGSSGFFAGISTKKDNQWNIDVTWTLSEPFGASDWLVCNEDLYDKIDSVKIHGITSQPNKFAANGLLTSVDTLANNKVQYNWEHNYPIAFYLIGIAITDYEVFQEYLKLDSKPDSMLVESYVYNRSNGAGTYLTQNLQRIKNTKNMVHYFSEAFIDYPYYNEKYGHMHVPLNGGMEHQTMSTMGNFNADLVAHELGHHWFGNYVTCATWSDIWLNEAFASYLEYLQREALESNTSASDWMINAHFYATYIANGSVYVPAGASENRIFNYYLTYKKGAAVVHTLRFLLGDEVFFDALNNFLVEFADSNATTQDFKNSVEQFTGENLDDYFNEWIYGEGYPEYTVEWNTENGFLLVNTTQTTSAPSSISAFTTPLPLVVYYANSTTDTVVVNPTAPMQAIMLTDSVSAISIDPKMYILKSQNSSIIKNETLTMVNVQEVQNLARRVSVYPNPANNQLNVESSFGSTRIAKILTVNGQLIEQTQLNNNSISIEHLTPGLYILELEFLDGPKARTKFVKS